MAALTHSRSTPELADSIRLRVYPVESDTVIYMGAIVAVNRKGNAVPASSSPDLRIVGCAESVLGGIAGQDADNRSRAAGATSIVCRRGIFQYADADESMVNVHIGKLAFAVDDNSVSINSGAEPLEIAPALHRTPAKGKAQIIKLRHGALVPGSVRVGSADGITSYMEGSDYAVAHTAGAILIVNPARIPPCSELMIAYACAGQARRSVAGRVVAVDPEGVWVDFWDQSMPTGLPPLTLFPAGDASASLFGRAGPRLARGAFIASRALRAATRKPAQQLTRR